MLHTRGDGGYREEQNRPEMEVERCVHREEGQNVVDMAPKLLRIAREKKTKEEEKTRKKNPPQSSPSVFLMLDKIKIVLIAYDNSKN
jgi:hypothetical protein